MQVIVSSRYICELLQPLWKISQNGRPNLDCHPSLFLFWVLGGDPLQFRGTISSLLSWSGLVEDKSCNVDVENELLPELADNPGTTRDTKLSDLHIIVFPSLANRGVLPLAH